jgi:hypothetical protein
MLEGYVNGKKKDIEKAVRYYTNITKKHGCYEKHLNNEIKICFYCLQLTLKKFSYLNVSQNIFEVLKDSSDKHLRTILDKHKGQTKLDKNDLKTLSDGFPDVLDKDIYLVDKKGNIVVSFEKLEVEKHQMKQKDENREYIYYKTFQNNKLMISEYKKDGNLYVSFGLSIGKKFAPIPLNLKDLKELRAKTQKAIRDKQNYNKKKKVK